jgi:fission process protein 1
LGYANEVGESFRYQFPHLVRPSYVLAFGYCFADAASSGWHVWNDKSYSTSTSTTKNNNSNNNVRMYQTALATADTLLWQSLASVMIPGATINVIVKATRMALVAGPSSPLMMMAAATVSTAAPSLIAKWLPTSLGLASIPLIIHPIDAAVDYALDNTTRRWWPLSEK